MTSQHMTDLSDGADDVLIAVRCRNNAELLQLTEILHSFTLHRLQ